MSSKTGKAIALKRVRGTGITTRTEVTLVQFSDASSPGDGVSEDAMFDHLYSWANRSWYAELELKAIKVLQKHSLPTSWGSFDVTHTGWRRRAYDEDFLVGDLLYRERTEVQHREKELLRSLNLAEIAAARYGEDSDAEFAARILVQIQALKRIDEADLIGFPHRSWVCQKIAFELGEISNAWTLKKWSYVGNWVTTAV